MCCQYAVEAYSRRMLDIISTVCPQQDRDNKQDHRCWQIACNCAIEFYFEIYTPSRVSITAWKPHIVLICPPGRRSGSSLQFKQVHKASEIGLWHGRANGRSNETLLLKIKSFIQRSECVSPVWPTALVRLLACMLSAFPPQSYPP